MDAEQQLFEGVATLFTRELSKAGLNAEKSDTDSGMHEGWHATVADWSLGRPRISIYFDKWLGTNDRHFWFGFEGQKASIQKLIRELKAYERRPIIWNNSHDRFEDEKGKPKTGSWEAIVRTNRGFVYERYGHAYPEDYVGKFDVGFESGSRQNPEKLVAQAAAFILEIMDEAERSEAKQVGEDYQTTVLARRGQWIFRRRLEEQWGGCAVTGCTVPEVLRASHILPWRSCTKEQRTEADNGLLLMATIDALFDKHLISFDVDGMMLFAETIEADDRERLALTGTKLSKMPTVKQKAYLLEHRKEAQRRWNCKLTT